MAELPHFLRTAEPVNRVRVLLTPPGAGEPVSVWADRTVTGLVLTVDVPEVAPGWAVAGRGFTGTVAAVTGRTLEVTP
jgi:hypothetical protein